MHTVKESDDSSLDGLPAWKRDLILKMRANSKSASVKTCNDGNISNSNVASAAGGSQQSCSGRGHQLANSCLQQGPSHSLRLVQGQKRSEVGVKSGSSVNAKRSVDLSESGPKSRYDSVKLVVGEPVSNYKMHHKGLGKSRKFAGLDMTGENDEEFQYGPGIVSRLKDRYLSLAMREAKSRSTLRKFSSLEDLLDEENPWPERGRNQTKIRAPSGSIQLKRDIMKRTRSVDSLSYRRQESLEKHMPKSRSSGVIKPQFCALAKEDVIIIEMTNDQHNTNDESNGQFLTRKSSSSSLLDEDELPQPDTVRQTKQIFESNGPVSVRGTAAAKVAAYKAAQTAKKRPTGVKPAIKAKPVILCNNNKGQSSPEVRPPWNAAVPNVKPLIRPTPITTSQNAKKPVASGLTPVTASVTAPLVNGDIKKEPDLPLRITSNQIPCDSSDGIALKTRPISPIPANLPASPPSSHKISIPSAFKDLDSSKENRRVQHENRKNAEKSTPFKEVNSNANHTVPVSPRLKSDEKRAESKVPIKLEELPTPKKVEIVETASYRSSAPLNRIIKPADPPPQPPLPVKVSPKGRSGPDPTNTVLFNFTKRVETPNYIENDGLDMSKRKQMRETSGYVIMPGYEGPPDSSTDDVDDEELSFVETSTPVCTVSFIGDGVIINGRSNLQRQPRNKKLEISFDLVCTTIHEYPSETSMIEHSDDMESYELNNVTSSPGGLANYTPSKLQLSDTFQLGVSQTHPPTPPKEKAPIEPLDDHLRPADDSEIVAWSSESAPDLLF